MWISLLSAVLGGGFALAGAWLTQSYNRKNAISQREHDRWKANRELYIAKGEELSSTFDEWIENNHQLHLLHTFGILGTKETGQVTVESMKFVNKALQPRIRTLSSLYFVELYDLHASISKLNLEAMMIYGKYLANEIDKSSAVIEIQEKIKKISQEADSFRLRLTAEIKKHI
ncbi:hypothetical protein [Pantoea agglomerans]|uniref:hypothetical protein n=1 Tax=Enterobacter agglomerans TaxID=549 RepID=UPI0028A12BD2|nr:hypothetical protein [Pantoea agglomerans]WNK52265.1 hypothetical protein RM154_12870 [Pantoea agglomerans]